jgi:hypothetical protein
MRNRVVAFAPGGNLLIQFERPLDAGEQFLVVERFFDEVAGAALQGATAIGTSPWPVTKMIGSCEPSESSFSCSSRPLISGIRTSSTRQPRISSRRAFRKALGGVEAGDLVAFAFEQPGHRVAHGFVVINDKNGLCHLIPLSSIGTVKRKIGAALAPSFYP